MSDSQPRLTPSERTTIRLVETTPGSTAAEISAQLAAIHPWPRGRKPADAAHCAQPRLDTLANLKLIRCRDGGRTWWPA